MPGIPQIDPYLLPEHDGLPANTAEWKIVPQRSVLLLHDLQEFFLRPLPESVRDPLLKRAASLRAACAERGVPIAYTAQPGDMTREQRGLLRDFWGPGMRVAPEDREVASPVRPDNGDWMLTKWRYSAFHSTELLSLMRRHNRDQLILCGVYAHVGILATAVDSFSNDIETFVIADAVADFSADDHWMALRYAAARCAVVASAEQALSALGGAFTASR
ncbi:isochorismatase family protein [Salinactinospora qingdaonensis]|uniref:Isochorismatase family protein n=1 Tax=Salinactinospora qingdaonensis TaxID=702744 RepID=A0ABP7FLA8_9ACTN